MVLQLLQLYCAVCCKHTAALLLPCRCRREQLPTYKANRAHPPADFRVDLSNLQLLLQFTRVPTLSIPGYEADDVGSSVSRVHRTWARCQLLLCQLCAQTPADQASLLLPHAAVHLISTCAQHVPATFFQPLCVLL